MADDINKTLAAMNAMIGTAPVRVKVPTATEMYASWQKAAADLDGNPYPEITQAVPDGWMAFKVEGGFRLVRDNDRQSIMGSANPKLWANQVLDFEFHEGTEWKPEQIAAMTGATGSTDWPEAPKGLNGPAGSPWMVEATQIDEEDCWAKAMNAPVSYLPYSSGTEEALRRALLSILGDMPSPSEDPWERCRGIAAEALGYQRPDPIERPDNRPWPTRDNPLGEQRQRDPVAIGPRVEVTKKMIDAARLVTDEMGATDYISRFILEPIYRAMHAAAPVPLVSEAEDRIAALKAELLHARMARDEWSDRDQLAQEVSMLRRALAAKDARIAELKSVLASTPVAFEDPDAKPVPVPSFLRAIREGNKAVVGLTTGRGDMPRSDGG